MAKYDCDFWSHFEKWENEFRGRQAPEWRGGWLDNPLCGECRLCCGPQGSDDPFPMALLPQQMKNGYREHFYLLNDCTACLAEKGCKSSSSSGCMLERKDRPVACGLFPYVLANGCLYLYLKCPSTLFVPLAHFFETGRKVADWLGSFSLQDLQRISLSLPLKTLSEKYVDLRIDIFNADGKC